ncbi:MAG: hypothetical protein ACLSXO_03875 [Coprococcus sp.]
MRRKPKVEEVSGEPSYEGKLSGMFLTKGKVMTMVLTEMELARTALGIWSLDID